MKKTGIILSLILVLVTVTACSGYTDGYEGRSVTEVKGRQGICSIGSKRFVSGTDSITKYNWNWSPIGENEKPFEGYEKEVNQLGDLDAYDSKIYAAAEYLEDGNAKNMQIGVYDPETLELAASYPIDEKSGQTGCTGIAIDPENGFVWLTSWAGDDEEQYIYRYSIEDMSYLGKTKLTDPPVNIKAIAYYEGGLYVTADDGNCEKEEPDHMYLVTPDEDLASATLTEEKEFNEVLAFGEIKGLTFTKKKKMFILQNRGAVIEDGSPVGLYDDYDSEISEVYTYGVIN